jgi:hypothetical protein
MLCGVHAASAANPASSGDLIGSGNFICDFITG